MFVKTCLRFKIVAQTNFLQFHQGQEKRPKRLIKAKSLSLSLNDTYMDKGFLDTNVLQPTLQPRKDVGIQSLHCSIDVMLHQTTTNPSFSINGQNPPVNTC